MDKESKLDAYHKWLGIPPRHQPPDHYRLLGIEQFEADSEVIQAAAARQMAHVQTYRIGPDSEVSQKLLNEIAKAKLCLSNPALKEEYDRYLSAETVARRPRTTTAGPITLQDTAKPRSGQEQAVSSSGSTGYAPILPSTGDAKRRARAFWKHSLQLGGGLFAVAIGGLFVVAVGVILAVFAAQRSGDSITVPSRWFNQTYSSTIRHIQGNQWNEYTNATGELRLRFTETGRTDEYLELFCAERNQELRLSIKGRTFELKQNGRWRVISTGYWLKGEADKPLVAGKPDLSKHSPKQLKPVIYLSDMMEEGFEVWKYRPWFGFGKNGQFVDSEDRLQKKIVLGGKESPKGIFAHPKPQGISKVSYSFAELPFYRKFEATVGVCDARRYDPESPLVFEVWGNHQVLRQSQPVVHWGQPQPCKVDLVNVSHLDLLVHCRGGAAFAFAVWCDPKLTSPKTASPESPAASAPAHPRQDDEIVIADFEADGYGEWTATGEAFGPYPARGTLPAMMHVNGFHGNRLVNSFSEKALNAFLGPISPLAMHRRSRRCESINTSPRRAESEQVLASFRESTGGK